MPFAAAPVVDGQVGAEEWSAAAAFPLGRGVTLRVMQDAATVYLAVSGLAPDEGMGFACVMVAEPGQVRVMHASAKLGTAIYTPAAGGTFDPRSKTYEWREADVLLRDEGWMATTVGSDRGREQEFAIRFDRLGLPGKAAPVAVGYLVTPPDANDLSAAAALVWPSGLDDAVADVQLLAGFNPDGLRFETTRWVTLRPDPRGF